MKLFSQLFSTVLLVLFCGESFGAGKELYLTEQYIVDTYLKNSPLVSKILNDIEIEKTKIASVYEPFTWEISAAGDYQRSKAEDFSYSDTNLNEVANVGLGISKSLFTGSEVSVDYNKKSIRDDFDGFQANPQLRVQNQNVLSFELKQDLYGNIFGFRDRLGLKVFESNFQATTLGMVEDLEANILGLLKERNNLLVARAKLDSAKTSYGHFEKLVKVVRRRESLGATKQGDAAVARAQLEELKQSILDTEQTVFETEQKLLEMLGVGFDYQIKVDEPADDLVEPVLPDFQVKSLRPIVIREKNIDRFKSEKRIVEDQLRPDVDLVGKYDFTGLEAEDGASVAEMTTWDRPAAYVGLQLKYRFGEGYLKNSAAMAEMELRKQELTRDAEVNKMTAQEASLRRQIKTSVLKHESLKKALRYRESALSKIERSYRQAQASVDDYINQVDRLFKARNAYIKNKGEYRLLLHQYASLADKLIDLDRLKEK